MVAPRIFGAQKGAGTQAREARAAKPIQEGPIGSVIVVGAYRSGPIGKVMRHTGGRPMYARICGGLTQDSEAPLACEHFHEAGAGAGTLHTLRITDGTEVAASLVLYDRDVELGVLERTPAAKVAGTPIKVNAWNGGRWAGRRAVKTGDVALGAAISGSTIDLGFETLADRWAGAVLRLPVDDPTAEYEIIGNTAPGVFTIAGDFTPAAIAGASGVYVLELENVHELTGQPEALGVEISDSGEIVNGFSLYVHRDGQAVKAYEDRDLDSAGQRYWLDTIVDDLEIDNFEIAPVDNFDGDAADAYKRPANFAEIPAPDGVTSNVLVFQVVRWTHDGTHDAYLDTTNDMAWGSDPRPCTISIAFTGAGAFTPTATFADGETADDLPAGVIGTAYAAPNPHVPGFTLRERSGGTAPVGGDTLTIYVRTLPAGLSSLGAWLYVAAGPADGDTRKRYRVASNDHESVTLDTSADLIADVTAPGAPKVTGTIAGPFTLAGSETWIGTIGGDSITLTQTLVGAAVTATALAAELNAQELTRAGGVAAAKLVQFGVSADDELTATALQDFGAAAVLAVGAGTLNAIVGITGATATGATPTRCRLQWRQELGGGYDGIAAIAAEHYVAAWSLGASPLNTLLTENTGVLIAAMPGITDADAQAAAMAWAYETNGLFLAEIPDTTTSEAAAIAWHQANLAIGPAQDYHFAIYPSYAKIRSPYGAGLYTAPVSGLFLGLLAKRATAAGGYQDAPAGTSWTLSPWLKGYPDGVPEVLSNEVLNAYGLIELRKRGPKVYTFGDRIPGDGGRVWLHKRLTLSHIGRTLLTNTESLTFRRIDRATLAEVKKLLIGLFGPWYRRGYFDDSDGPAFEDAVSLKVDETNNPQIERDLGNLHASIGFDVVNTAERVIFTYGPKGLIEG